jgi:hypothetical protein
MLNCDEIVIELSREQSVAIQERVYGRTKYQI